MENVRRRVKNVKSNGKGIGQRGEAVSRQANSQAGMANRNTQAQVRQAKLSRSAELKKTLLADRRAGIKIARETEKAAALKGQDFNRNGTPRSGVYTIASGNDARRNSRKAMLDDRKAGGTRGGQGNSSNGTARSSSAVSVNSARQSSRKAMLDDRKAGGTRGGQSQNNTRQRLEADFLQGMATNNVTGRNDELMKKSHRGK